MSIKYYMGIFKKNQKNQRECQLIYQKNVCDFRAFDWSYIVKLIKTKSSVYSNGRFLNVNIKINSFICGFTGQID